MWLVLGSFMLVFDDSSQTWAFGRRNNEKFIATPFVNKEAQEIMAGILETRNADTEILIRSDRAVNKDDDTDLFYCLWEAESEADIHQA